MAASVALVPLLLVGACTGDDGAADDPTTLGILTESGDVVAALQSERRATRAITTGSFDEPGTAPDWGVAGARVDNALDGLAEVVHDADRDEYLEVYPTVDQAVVGVAEPRGMMAALSISGGRVDDGGATAARYTPLVTDVLRLHLQYADSVEDDELAPLARLWARMSLQIEDVDRVIALAAGDPAEWPDQIDAHYRAVIDGRDRLATLAQDTDLAGATADLEEALGEAGFGGPAPPDTTGGTVQAFLDSLAVDAWFSYRDAVREKLDAALEAAAGA